MKKVLITIVGRDRPGIVYQVGRVLSGLNCNILEISQTTLLGEFAGLFSTRVPQAVSVEELSLNLARALEDTGLGYWVKEVEAGAPPPPSETGEPYVISLQGPDRQGLVPEFASILAGLEVNIDNLRAMALTPMGQAFDPHGPVVLIFEVTVPEGVHHGALRQALFMKAEELGLEASIQHRNIFEAIHRL